METLSIIKIGGKAIEEAQELSAFLQDFANVAGPKILVHGGGRNASQMAQKLGLTPTIIEGRRVTDAAMLAVVVMVYAGQVNKSIVSTLQAYQCNALGFTGADANIIVAQQRNPHPIDYGFVGDIIQVNVAPLLGLLEQSIVPIIAPLTHDGQGNLLNTNADTMTARLAQALTDVYQVNVHYCFEKPGVLQDPQDDASWLPTLNPTQYAEMKARGIVADGMVPKLDNAFQTLQSGVQEVYIMHYRAVAHLTNKLTGTRLCL